VADRVVFIACSEIIEETEPANFFRNPHHQHAKIPRPDPQQALTESTS